MVVGIDTSSYGYHAFATEPFRQPHGHLGIWYDLRTGWFRAEGDAMERRKQIYWSFVVLFQELSGREARVFVEEPLVLMKNTETTRKLVMIGGIIEAALHQEAPDLFFHWVDVATWRKAVLGKGSGSKQAMKDMARVAVTEAAPAGFDQILFDTEPDLYDAACICEYGKRAK